MTDLAPAGNREHGLITPQVPVELQEGTKLAEGSTSIMSFKDVWITIGELDFQVCLHLLPCPAFQETGSIFRLFQNSCDLEESARALPIELPITRQALCVDQESFQKFRHNKMLMSWCVLATSSTIVPQWGHFLQQP